MQATDSRRALKWLTGAIFLLVCGFSMCSNIIGVTMDPMIGAFSLTGASQGLMTSMINLGSTLPLLVIPLLQGRVHKTWLIIFGGILQVFMLVLTGMAQSVPVLLAACALLGAGNNFTDSCVNSYIVDLHPTESTRYLGLLHGFFGVGGLITPLLISAIIGASGWRAAYYVAAVIFAVICAVFTWVSLKNRRRVMGVAPASEAPITKAMFKAYFSTRRNLMLLGAIIFYAASQLGLVNWVVRYMSVRFDNAELGSICMSAYWICTAICRIFSSRLPFAPHKMMVFGAAGAGVFHFIGVISGNPIVMLICTGLLGLVSGLCIPVIVGEAALGNEDKTALSTAALFLLMGLSRMLMPLLMGAVAADSITNAMLLPAGAAIISAVFCHLANRDRPAQ
ncbi:MAG: MFS transporter [Clostridia bacterium]|nr:MFS transporter [Clostridia bacterium]